MNHENFLQSHNEDTVRSHEIGKNALSASNIEDKNENVLTGEICGMDIEITKLYDIIGYISSSLGEISGVNSSKYIDGVLEIIGKAKEEAEKDDSLVEHISEKQKLTSDWEITERCGQKNSDRVFHDEIFNSWIWAREEEVGKEGICDQDEERQYIIMKQDGSRINIQSVISSERGLYDTDEYGQITRVAILPDGNSYHEISVTQHQNFSVPAECLYRAVEASLGEAVKMTTFSDKREYAEYLIDKGSTN